MTRYDWKNTQTGEIVETDSCDIPPDDSGQWVRDYSFGVRRINGAGGSPGWQSVKKNV